MEACESVPDANHIKHGKKHAIHARQYGGIFNDVTHNGKPLDEAILGAWRWFALALAESPHDCDYNICGYSLGGIQILYQCGYTCLVQFGLS
jgi:hypothetical protein